MATLFRNLAFALLTCFFTGVAWASSLEKMEAVVKKAPDLRAFLADPALVEEYYSEAHEYYGKDKFPRTSYDAILNQLRELDEKSPAVGARLWETTGLGKDFAIELGLPRSGLELRGVNWTIYLHKRVEALQRASGELAAMSFKERSAHIQEVFARKLGEIERFEKEVLPQTPKAERGRLTQEFYQNTLREDKDLKAIGAYLAHRKLSRSGPLRSFLKSETADGVLYAWGELRKAGGLDSNGIAVPQRLQRFLADSALPELPKPEKLELGSKKTSRTEFFKVATQTSRDGKKVPAGAGAAGSVDFRALPRRFHGIFKGVRLGECVGGNCDSLYALTPERWATIALADSRLYQVERNGAYQGFAQVVPVELKGKTYGSLEFGSPLLRQQGFVANPETGKIEATQLASAFSKRLKPELPTAWEGLIVSSGSEINNAGVLDNFRHTPVYHSGAIVGNRSEVTHPDPLAKEIVRGSPAKGSFISSYAGNMVTDATAKSDLPLSQLNLEARTYSTEFPMKEVLADAKKLFAFLKSAKPALKEPLLEVFSAQRLELDPKGLIDPKVVRRVLQMATAEKVDLDPRVYQQELYGEGPKVRKELGDYLFAMRGNHRTGLTLQWEIDYRKDYATRFGLNADQVATLKRESRARKLRGCQQGFAAFVKHPGTQAVAVTAVGGYGALEAGRYLTRPGPPEKQVFGCNEEDAHLALRKGRWGCDEGKGGAFRIVCESSETFERVDWLGVFAAGVKGKARVQMLRMFDTYWRGLDGNTYASCHNRPDEAVCQTCESSTPVNPVRKKMRVEGELAFAFDSEGNSVFLGIADDTLNGVRLERRANGEIYLFDWRKEPNKTVQRLLDAYPQWRTEILRAEQQY